MPARNPSTMTIIDATSTLRFVVMSRLLNSGLGHRGPAFGLHPSHQMLNEIFEDRRVELVVDRLAAPLGNHQTTRSQNSQMPGNGGPARMKLIGDFAGGFRPAAQELQNRAAGF